MMKSCSTVQSVVLLLTIMSISEADDTVKVVLNGRATLPCPKSCSGEVRWTLRDDNTDVLALCNQTSCSSVKKGYQISHDEYKKGDLSLIISEADFSKRNTYTCKCGHVPLCDVILQIETVVTAVQIKAGESLILKLDVSDPVQVMYYSTDTAGKTAQICTVTGQEVHCSRDFTLRSSELELRGMTPSDGGVYNIRVIKTDEVIRSYGVTVREPVAWKAVLVTGLFLLLIATVIGLLFFTMKKSEDVRKENQLQLEQVPIQSSTEPSAQPSAKLTRVSSAPCYHHNLMGNQSENDSKKNTDNGLRIRQQVQNYIKSMSKWFLVLLIVLLCGLLIFYAVTLYLILK